MLTVVAAVDPAEIVLSTVSSNATVVPLPLVAIGRCGWSRILHFRVLFQQLFASKIFKAERCFRCESSVVAMLGRGLLLLICSVGC